MYSFAKYSKYTYILIIISSIVRLFLAGILELGNDEVYYRLYGLYPDWSHFDHPLMIGILIQITTLNMLLQHELFLRLGAVIIGAINIWLIFKIGLLIKGPKTGFFASLLYVSSIYASIINGVFILPDAPQSLFWLWALLIMIQTVPKCPNQPLTGLNFLKLSVVLGLGILSKYTTIFLWFGIGAYILIFNREWLKKKWLYFGILISAVIASPILIWNIQNNFISINFHSERVDMSGYSINPDYLLSEILGEFLYNNPIVYILIIISIIVGLRGKLDIEKSHFRVILLSGLPIVITFIIFSLFRRTLPHWTAPGIISMIPLAAVYIVEKSTSFKRIPGVITASLSITIIVIILGMVQIRIGIINLGSSTDPTELGSQDPSLDMYGYSQAGQEFADIVGRDIKAGLMDESSILIGDKWFPLANFEYYAARPIGMNSLALGELKDIHKYAWINKIRGGFNLGMDAYYLTDSRTFREPSQLYYEYFNEVIPADTIQVIRNNKHVKNIFVYRMKDLKKIPSSVIN